MNFEADNFVFPMSGIGKLALVLIRLPKIFHKRGKKSFKNDLKFFVGNNKCVVAD